jgi:5-methyltetrahydropteroyltriglutamate--homocysteine methyltransferase
MSFHRLSERLLPTTVVGSYSVPEWLERFKTDFYQHRVSSQYLQDVHENVINAAIKDQEQAGIDVVSDGELRRDNDIDYLLSRIAGIQIPNPSKSYYFDYFDACLTSRLAGDEPTAIGLAEDFSFTRCYTQRPIKFSFTGPFSLAQRVRNEAYSNPDDLVRALAERLNAEAHRLVAAGATILQIDEPFLAGYPEQVGIAMEGINIVTRDVEANWALHVCYGNRYARPSWEGHYDFLFPAVLDAHVDQLVLEFARKGYDDLRLLPRYGWDRALGLGVIDVKTNDVESAQVVATRVRRALDVVGADQLVVNPDCGLRHLRPDTARAKLAAMVAGAAIVRDELAPPAPADPPSDPAADPSAAQPAVALEN